VAGRIQFQYQPVTGPVWREPVAEKLAWLPRAQQPVRGLPPNRLGDFAQPPFDTLYKVEGLQWIPSDRYAGRALAYSLTRYTVLDPIPPVNPRLLDWLPKDRYYGRALSRSFNNWSVNSPFIVVPAYDPQNPEWVPNGRWQPQRTVGFIYVGGWVIDPVTPPPAPPPLIFVDNNPMLITPGRMMRRS